MKKFATMTEKELLVYTFEIMNELKERGIIRTKNNPIADYCEWLVANKFEWILENSSKVGYDVVDASGLRVQIKCRVVGSGSNSRQLGVIRKLDENTFDYLIAILFDEKVEVISAYKISKELIKEYAKFSAHQNGHILSLKGDLLADKQIRDITQALK